MKAELAIIGYGRFGKFAAAYLKRHFSIVVSDRRHRVSLARGIRRVSIADAARKSIILLCVPISQMESVVRRIAPLLQPGSLVIDVASVKEMPVRWLKESLPQEISILGTHPLFGPDSAADSLKGRHIALCPVRIAPQLLSQASRALTSKGLKIHMMTPTAHDRLMVSTLFLTQLVGRGLVNIPLTRSDIGTKNSEFLTQIIATARNDTKELFLDMYRYNRHARALTRQVFREFQALSRQLRNLPGTRR